MKTRVWTVIYHAHSSLHISGPKPFVRSWKNQGLLRLGHSTGTPGLTELENLLKVYLGGLDWSLDPLVGLHLRLYSVRLHLVPCIDMTMSQVRTHLKTQSVLHELPWLLAHSNATIQTETDMIIDSRTLELSDAHTDKEMYSSSRLSFSLGLITISFQSIHFGLLEF